MLLHCLFLYLLQPGSHVTFPIAADPNKEVIKQLNMVDPNEKDKNGQPLPSRTLHLVGPDKKVHNLKQLILFRFQLNYMPVSAAC